MGKIAFVFSGQGDQFPGMGKDLYEKYPVAKKIFNLCDEIRPGTSAQCFNGTEDELKETKNTQPCLFAMELSAASVLIEKGIAPDVAAGFSLGEVVAATVSGAFDNETGFRLVCKRGELMQSEAEKFDTSMKMNVCIKGVGCDTVSIPRLEEKMTNTPTHGSRWGYSLSPPQAETGRADSSHPVRRRET